MPTLKILPRDALFGRASWTLWHLALHDAPDPTKKCWTDRSECVVEMETVRRELEAIGENWDVFYGEIIADAEARAEFESDDQWHDSE